MTSHWQEIIAILVVALALIWVLRRLFLTWRNITTKGTCGCGTKSCRAGKAETKSASSPEEPSTK